MSELTVGEEACLDDPPSVGVDINAKARAIIEMFAAHDRLNLQEVCNETGVDLAAVSKSLPSAYAEFLAEDTLAMLMGAESIGIFVVKAVETLGSIINVVRALTSDVPLDVINKLVQEMANYTTAPAGSPAEVLADQRIMSLVDVINETVLRRNNNLFAGFADEESGFSASASHVVMTAFDEDDDDDDSSDESDDEEIVHHS